MKHITSRGLYLSILLFFLLFYQKVNAQVVFPQWVENCYTNAFQTIVLSFEVDSSGNSYVYENSQDTSSSQTYSGRFIHKYNSVGQLQWTQNVSVFGKMKLGKDGFIYVGGTLWNNVTHQYDFNATKVDTSGNILWSAVFGSPQSLIGGDFNNMVLDDSCNLLMVGTTYNLDSAITIKCDSSGNFRWYNAFNANNFNYYDRGNDIAVDSYGDVYIAIASMDTSSNYDAQLVKYSATGNQMWTQRVTGPERIYPYYIKIFNDTLIYVVGEMGYDTISGSDYSILAYNSSGQMRWSRVFDASAYYSLPYTAQDFPRDMYVTHSGNLLITGSCMDNGMPWWVNLMYDPQGNLVWVNRDFNTTIGYGRSITEDNYGHLIFSGEAYNYPNSGFGMGITKYDTLGSVLWSTLYYANMFDVLRGSKVGVDNAGNIYCSSPNFSAPASITTLKFGAFVNVLQPGSTSAMLSLFPNPAEDFITVKLTGMKSDKILIKVTDLIGQTIFEKEEKGLFDAFECQLNLKGLSAGIYLISIQTEEGDSVTQKFTKKD